MKEEEFKKLTMKEEPQVRAILEDFMIKNSANPCYVHFTKERYLNLVQLAVLVSELEFVNTISKPDYYILPPSDKRPPRLDITQWGYRTLLNKKGYSVNTILVTQEFEDKGYFKGYSHTQNRVLWDESKAHLVSPTEPLDIALAKYIVVSITNNKEFFVEKVYTPEDIRKIHAPKGTADLWSGKEKQYGISDAKHVQKTMYLKSVVRDLITSECRGLIPEALLKAQYNASEDVIDLIRSKIESSNNPAEIKSILNQASAIKDYTIGETAMEQEKFLRANADQVQKLCNKLEEFKTITELLDYYTDKTKYAWFCNEDNVRYKNLVDGRVGDILDNFLLSSDVETTNGLYKKYQDFFENPLNRIFKTRLLERIAEIKGNIEVKNEE